MPRLRKTSTRRPRRSNGDRQTVQRLLELLRIGKDLRQRKARVTRAKIKVRAYENELKLEIAADRMLADVLEPT